MVCLHVGDCSPKSPRSPGRQSSYQQCRSPTQSPGARHSLLTTSPGSNRSPASPNNSPRVSPGANIQYTYNKETCIVDPRTVKPVPKSSLRISDSTSKQRELNSGSCRLLYGESAEMT